VIATFSNDDDDDDDVAVVASVAVVDATIATTTVLVDTFSWDDDVVNDNGCNGNLTLYSLEPSIRFIPFNIGADG
jgi:hypothetical protein